MSFCYHFSGNVDGAMWCFVFVGAAFGVRRTVVTPVGCSAGERTIARPNEDTGRPQKGKKHIVKPKIVAGTA
jgi:hypothetical protein